MALVRWEFYICLIIAISWDRSVLELELPNLRVTCFKSGVRRVKSLTNPKFGRIWGSFHDNANSSASSRGLFWSKSGGGCGLCISLLFPVCASKDKTTTTTATGLTWRRRSKGWCTNFAEENHKGDEGPFGWSGGEEEEDKAVLLYLSRRARRITTGCWLSPLNTLDKSLVSKLFSNWNTPQNASSGSLIPFF